MSANRWIMGSAIVLATGAIAADHFAHTRSDTGPNLVSAGEARSQSNAGNAATGSPCAPAAASPCAPAPTASDSQSGTTNATAGGDNQDEDEGPRIVRARDARPTTDSPPAPTADAP